ncbi:MAG: ribose ABC transporter permease [Pyrinomonadaceae bacterium]|jgi:ribose/xylose/arabinose/galactoside ABC-type transport system permease subunit|nr:ribose ABC transporter permease [Pyrinomonadaceae bacterium]
MKQIQKYIIVFAIFVQVIVFSMLSPQFLSVDNLVNVALSIAITGILAVGMTFVILTGGIDLSIGSVLALAGICAAICAKSLGDAGVFLGVIVAILIGVLCGFFAGITVSRFKVPPFVVTLAILTIARGLSFIIADKFSGSTSVSDLPSGFAFLGREKIFGLPVPVITMLIVFAIGWFILTQTRFGRYVYAIGGNSEASFLAGINVKSITTWVYVLNGFLVGLAGVILASRLGAGLANAGMQYELDVIAAVVVGGTSLMGGKGSVISTLFGAIFIGVLNNGLNLAGIDPYLQKIALGVVILLAVLADQINKK